MTAMPSSMRLTRTPAAVHRDARLLVVACVIQPGAEADLEPAAGEHVDGGQLLGQHDRVLVVVVEHERADLQRGGGVGRGHQRRHGRELVAEVVGHEERGVPEVLGLAGELGPGLRVGHRRGGGATSWMPKRNGRGWAMGGTLSPGPRQGPVGHRRYAAGGRTDLLPPPCAPSTSALASIVALAGLGLAVVARGPRARRASC